MKGKNVELSIIIVSYNVCDLLDKCIDSIYKSSANSHSWQVIVVDNDSKDDTVKKISDKYKKVEMIDTGKNNGFAKGNNIGIKKAVGEYVLFLNPDTIVEEGAIDKSLEFIKSDGEIGALTCKVVFPDGKMDYSCHRGLPTPWNSLSYFLRLSKIFPNSKFFSGYTASYMDMNTTHQIECGSGTFFLVSRVAGNAVNWWDEDYWWNGEDIEFCYQLIRKGFKVYYFADAKIIHYKSSSSGLWSTAALDVNIDTKIRSAKAAAQAMRIFYGKHFSNNFWEKAWSNLVLLGIGTLEWVRIYKIKKGKRYE